MFNKSLLVLVTAISLNPALGQDSGNARKLSTQDLDQLKRKLEPTMRDPRFKDVEIQIKPGGVSTKACVHVDGKVCCGGRDSCGSQQ